MSGIGWRGPLLAVLLGGACGSPTPPSDRAHDRAPETPAHRCEERVEQMREDLAALETLASLRARSRPAALVEGEGGDAKVDAILAVTASELAWDGRPLGQWPAAGEGSRLPRQLDEALAAALAEARPERLGLAIDGDAPWAKVVATTDALRAHGRSQVVLLFDGPPPSVLDRSRFGRELERQPPDERLAFAAQRVHELTEDCAPVREVFERMAREGSDAAEAEIARALPEAVTRCQCATEVETLAEVFLVLTLPALRVVGSTIELGGDEAPPLIQPPEVRWREVARGVEAAGQGRRWSFDGGPALEPEPEPEPPRRPRAAR